MLSRDLDGPIWVDEATLRAAVWKEEWGATGALVDMLIERGRFPEAEEVARQAVVFGEYQSYSILARVLSEWGREEDAARSRWAAIATGR
jgi:hypothetical protein